MCPGEPARGVGTAQTLFTRFALAECTDRRQSFPDLRFWVPSSRNVFDSRGQRAALRAEAEMPRLKSLSVKIQQFNFEPLSHGALRRCLEVPTKPHHQLLALRTGKGPYRYFGVPVRRSALLER